MPVNWTPFVDLVRRHQRFLITTHVRPDPDGLGSQLGLADALDQKLSSHGADALFAAVATDTGWFRHLNTTPATFALAEKLARAGARVTFLYDRLYEHSTLPRMKLLGLMLSRLRTLENGQVA